MKQKLTYGIKIGEAFLFLYLFLVSISLMEAAVALFGKGFAERLISSCSNPFVGLFIGILVTSIIQSSSVTTSLVVGFAGGGGLPITYAVPIIMGANIIVSLAFVTRKEDFKRALTPI